MAVTAPLAGPGDLEAFTSNRTGSDTATLADTHGYRTFAGAPAVTDADTSDWQYGHENLATVLASGNAGSGLAVMTGSDSQRLDYDGVFFLWQTAPRGEQVPGIG